MKKILFSACLIAALSMGLSSCGKTDPDDPGKKDKTMTVALYVPYYEAQLEYVNCEFTITTSDGGTKVVTLSKSTAKDDNSKETTALRNNVAMIASLNGVTDALKVFKVCEFTTTEGNPYYGTCKYSTTGNFKTDGTEFNMVSGSSWYTKGGSTTGDDTSANVFKGVYTDEENLNGFVSTLNEKKNL